MRIAIFGSGGVGGYFGGRLAQSGEHVIFIARGEHLQAMQTHGLRVESIKGSFSLPIVQATDNPRQVGEVDAILVCVKAWQALDTALAMRPMLGKGTMVVPLCNGVDAPSELQAALGHNYTVGGLCRISAAIIAPGIIRHSALEPYISVGELNREKSERIERVCQTFERAGVNAIASEDIWAAMWQKFIFIAPISGLGALTRSSASVFRDIPETRQLLEKAIQEIHSLARIRKIALPDDITHKTLAFIDSLSPEVIPSMQRDILEGKPSELASQNGAVVRMGLEAGIPTPVHAFIYAALLPLELKARGEILF